MSKWTTQLQSGLFMGLPISTQRVSKDKGVPRNIHDNMKTNVNIN